MKFKEEINAQQAKYNPEMTGFYIILIWLTLNTYEILNSVALKFFSTYTNFLHFVEMNSETYVMLGISIVEFSWLRHFYSWSSLFFFEWMNVIEGEINAQWVNYKPKMAGISTWTNILSYTYLL